MTTVRSDHFSANVLSALLIQLFGQGADASLLTLDLGLELGEGGGLFFQLATEGILCPFSLELLSLESMGDAHHLGVGGNVAASIDVAWRGISAFGNDVGRPPRYRRKSGKGRRHEKVFCEIRDIVHS